MSYTQEQIAKAKQAKSAEELLALAKAEGVALTGEEAAKYFAELHKEDALSEDELGNVSGGCGEETPPPPQEYVVKAGWEPSCDGRFVRANGRAYAGLSEYCCGMCTHFKFNGCLDVHKEGVCRREFES